MCTYIIRPILPLDDKKMAKIVRDNLKKFHLNIPESVMHNMMNRFYLKNL